jgi:hypothetical protein
VSDALTPEQEARNLLERMWVDDAQDWSAGDVAELANILARLAEAELRRLEIGAAVATFRQAFVIAVGDKSPFAQHALAAIDAAMGESRGNV